MITPGCNADRRYPDTRPIMQKGISHNQSEKPQREVFA
jgi:hypothetical protein